MAYKKKEYRKVFLYNLPKKEVKTSLLARSEKRIVVGYPRNDDVNTVVGVYEMKEV